VEYVIGAGDTLQIFVWRNPEVSVTVPVRPDGKISTPLVEDMVAAGKTPTQVAREIEHVLAGYLKEPLVTVIVTAFSGSFQQQIRVVGEVAHPSALMYRANMSLLDVMIQVGGLTDFAAGNRASIVRNFGGQQQQFSVRLNDLVRSGDVKANVPVMPGDIIFVPESWF
jgi:polysaccharide export outer membrane protein